ncbi:hypothetical protein LEP1GSC016_0522 [Leptospira borgpetersenii serovar Hardjo-bovis str. Sponselee]|uniref:Uncharacterized protein n=1 Tax=Leptospira borgpetersenii serovar Hardjo-bovis str. Sponselee TaxID=1303729 RepID=M6BX50_LEPBO|nr:hypothetical protein LEP1GSC016_0522 [Leptospira borgpetersenii serovar Hardjo-bovis str. Sponselee]
MSNSKELDKFREIFDLKPISKLSSVGVWIATDTVASSLKYGRVS